MERLGTKVRVVQADLGAPLGFLADASFDIVLSALVLNYVRDWGAAFRESYRVLRQGGLLIFSVDHPFADPSIHNENERVNYFQTELVEYEWTGFGTPVRVPSYRRPLGAMINPLLEAGFVLDRLLEPIPTEKFKQQVPQYYEGLSRQPGFLCVRAVKPIGKQT